MLASLQGIVSEAAAITEVAPPGIGEETHTPTGTAATGEQGADVPLSPTADQFGDRDAHMSALFNDTMCGSNAAV